MSAMKLCECGCGEQAKNRFVSGHNSVGSLNPNWRGGSVCICGCNQPCRHGRKFLSGHEPRKISNHGDGYLTVHHDGKHQLEHRVVVATLLKMQLPTSVIVHHHNERRGDNKPGNLVVCESRAYHHLLHQRANAYYACGHASWRKCSACKLYVDPSELYNLTGRGSVRHRGGCKQWL